jgi:hypothetical protein
LQNPVASSEDAARIAIVQWWHRFVTDIARERLAARLVGTSGEIAAIAKSQLRALGLTVPIRSRLAHDIATVMLTEASTEDLGQPDRLQIAKTCTNLDWLGLADLFIALVPASHLDLDRWLTRAGAPVHVRLVAFGLRPW